MGHTPGNVYQASNIIPRMSMKFVNGDSDERVHMQHIQVFSMGSKAKRAEYHRTSERSIQPSEEPGEDSCQKVAFSVFTWINYYNINILSL